MSDSRIKVIIVEDNRDLCRSLTSFFNKKDYLEVIGVAYDGLEALKMINSLEADIVLLDIVLPSMDGMSVLEEIKKNMKAAGVIMLTAMSNDSMTKRAMDVGADYFIVKPFDMDVLAKRILQIYEYRISLDTQGVIINKLTMDSFTSSEQFITSILHKLGVSVKLNGYLYLKSAIANAIMDDSMLDSITKILYPAVAKEFDTNINCIERSIRHALKSAWDKDGGKNYYKLLGYDEVYIGDKLVKPSNGSFISAIVEYYKLNKK